MPIAAGLGWLAVQFLRLPWWLWARYRKREVAAAWSSFVRPLWLVLGVLAHGVLVSYLRIPVLQRHRYQQVAGVVAVDRFQLAVVAHPAGSAEERAATGSALRDAWARNRS